MRVLYRRCFRVKVVKYTPDGHSIAKCEKCLRLLSVHAGVSLIAHLVYEHKLPEQDSIETVRWISAKVLESKLKAKNDFPRI